MRSPNLLITSTVVCALALGGVIACSAQKNEENNGQSQNAASAADPKGNNGTVKIQEAGAPDEIPDNDPHVGCKFDIEFRGFDMGADLMGSWELDAHPPSGNGTLIAKGDVNIGEDAAGGANDLDAVVHVNIGDYDLSGLFHQPQQGYHLELTVHADGSIGADVKHKVFWVDGCSAIPDAGASSSSGSTTSSSGSTTSSSGGSTTSSSGGSSSGKTW